MKYSIVALLIALTIGCKPTTPEETATKNKTNVTRATNQPAADEQPVHEFVVYPGESLADIARQYNASTEDLLRINNISDASLIKPGDKLLIPIPE